MNETEPLVAPFQGYSADLGFAIVACRTASGNWFLSKLECDFSHVRLAVSAAESVCEHGHAFSMICIAEDYFVVVRPHDDKPQLLLSDSCMAVNDTFASSALELIGGSIPELGECDLADPQPAGNLDILADLGLSAETMQAICSDYDLLPSAQLLCIATELGFSSEFEQVVELDLG